MSNFIESNYRLKVSFLFLFVFIIFSTVCWVYFSNFNGLYGSQEIFGLFGDFVGGVMNPLLSFSAILLIVWSIKLQIYELSDSRAELKRSADAQREISDKQLEALELQRQIFTLQQSVQVLDSVRKEIEHAINVKFISLNEGVYSFYDIAIGIDDLRNAYYKAVRESDMSSKIDRELAFNLNILKSLMMDYSNVMIYFVKGYLPDASVDFYLTSYLINMQRGLALLVYDKESYNTILDKLTGAVDESMYSESFKKYFKVKIELLRRTI